MALSPNSFIYLQDDYLNLIRGQSPRINMADLIKWLMGGAFGRMPIDRTDTIKYELRTKSIFPLPECDINYSKDIKTIFEDTAKSIINENKPIDIFWSGGVDSTSIVVAFLTVCKDLDQINIMFEPRSIDEYPLFYDKYIKHMNHMILNTYLGKNLRLNDHITISGDGGGILLGQWKILIPNLIRCGLKDTDALKMPWRDVINPKINFFNKNCDDFFADCIMEQLKYAPFNIETISDLQYWLGISMKWQGEWFWRLRWQKSITQEKLDNFRPFFLTEDFEKWSVWNYYNNLKNSPTVFKYDYKKYIYDFTKDEEYLANKGKIKSAAVYLSEDKNIGRHYLDGLDDQYNIHSTFDFSNRDLDSFRKYKRDFIEQFGNPESEYRKWIKY